MRTSKYSEEQIIGFLRQAEAGMPIKEIGRKHGFSDASFYKWRSKYGGMEVSEATCANLQGSWLKNLNIPKSLSMPVDKSDRIVSV